MNRYVMAAGLLAALQAAPVVAEQKMIPDLCEYATSELPNACARTQSFVTFPERSSQDSSGNFATASTSAYNVFEGKLYSADAFAKASVSRGQLGVAVSGNDRASSQASATIRDVITFNAADYDFAYFEIAIHGVAFSGQAGRVDLGYDISFESERYLSLFKTQYYISSKDSESEESLWSNHDFDINGERISDDMYLIQGAIRLMPGSSTFNFSSTMASFVNGPGYGAFGNTASLSFKLPEGVSLTSQSGLFLSEVGTIPEPTTWLMFILGFGFIAAVIRLNRCDRRIAHRSL
ncbi:hypothetical protein GCM10022268_11170 [Sphingomonas cynarae]|uniref:PEP-CTERM protein-sorting domain-containing protein n=1 Tax=Sphingomonas cynarae TaxID=930197 RepID=A0ABP7DHB1_9SPHN